MLSRLKCICVSLLGCAALAPHSPVGRPWPPWRKTIAHASGLARTIMPSTRVTQDDVMVQARDWTTLFCWCPIWKSPPFSTAGFSAKRRPAPGTREESGLPPLAHCFASWIRMESRWNCDPRGSRRSATAHQLCPWWSTAGTDRCFPLLIRAGDWEGRAVSLYRAVLLARISSPARQRGDQKSKGFRADDAITQILVEAGEVGCAVVL